MTAQEAHYKSLWRGLSQFIIDTINEAVERGKCYATLDKNLSLHFDDHHKLQELGYYIYFNKTTNSHEIRW